MLPSSQFKARGITPELYLDGIAVPVLYAVYSLYLGVPIAEVQPRFKPIDDFLFFSHIPRTAGGTFSILLNSLFLDEEQVPHSGSGSAVRDLDSYLAMTPEEWKALRVLYSHEDFSFVRLIPKRVAITVFLRDPIKVCLFL